MTSQPQLSTHPVGASGVSPSAAPASPVGAATDLLDSSPGTAPPPAAPSGPGADVVGAPGAAGPALPGGARAKPLLVGFLGTLLMAAGAFGAGGVLVHDPVLEGTPLAAWRFGHGFQLASMAVYLGLGLTVWAWVMLGRDVLARRVGGRAVLLTAGLWMLPVAVCPPLFTRDVFSYLAQGAMPLLGFDPYAGGPNVLPAGPLLDNVHYFWTDTPAPYGPLFILIAKGVVALTGSHMIAGVLLMRLIVLLGLGLFVAALPGLTEHLGGRVSVALWVAVANPVMVVHLVGGPHNDLLMVGLLSMGSLLVLNRRHAAGIAMVSLAMAVKATGGVALPFLVLVWARRLSGDQRTRIVKATAAGLAVFLPVFAGCSMAVGVGLGWLPALNSPSMIVNWLSLSTGSGQLLYSIVNAVIGGLPQGAFIGVTRALGAAALLYFGVRHWLAAREHGGADAVRRAGIVLVLVALLSPATLPWYYSWGIAMLAGTVWTVRRLQAVVVFSIFLLSFAFPNGEVALYSGGYLIAFLAGAVLAALALRTPDPLRLRRRPAAGAAQADPPVRTPSPARAA